MLKNWRRIAEKVKTIVHEIDPDAKVYVFGSVVRGRFTGASDIDVLIVTKRIDRKYEIMARVYSELEAPLELHIVTPDMFRKWYKRFINEKELIQI